jgi:hypothetical protein
MNADLFELHLQKMILSCKIELPQLRIPTPEFKIPEFNFKIPNIQMQPIALEMIRSSATPMQDFDYERIADEIVKKQGKMEDVSRPYVNVDEKGLHAFLEEKNRRTEYINKRYGFK